MRRGWQRARGGAEAAGIDVEVAAAGVGEEDAGDACGAPRARLAAVIDEDDDGAAAGHHVGADRARWPRLATTMATAALGSFSPRRARRGGGERAGEDVQEGGGVALIASAKGGGRWVRGQLASVDGGLGRTGAGGGVVGEEDKPGVG